MDKIYIIGRDEVPARLTLGAGESFRMTLVALPGVSADISMLVEMAGEGASADIAALYVTSGSDKLRLKIDLRHEVSGCTSRQLIKGLADDNSRFEFDGRILVQDGTCRTDATQENHNILLSESACAESRPQLEIYADDVICSHGATVGRLNDDELFYMRSRGIPVAEARRLQIISFLAPVLSRLPQALVSEIIEKL